MQLPQFVSQHENPEQNIFVTHNPAMINLMQIMVQLKQLYNEFVRLHAAAITARNPKSANEFFSPVTEIQRDQDSFKFVVGFLGIVSVINTVDLADSTSIVQSKRIIFATITDCERHFFNFNQRFQTVPALTKVIAQMYIAINEIKQELSKFGLYDFPGFDPSQNSVNPTAQAREREEDATIGEKACNRKRLG